MQLYWRIQQELSWLGETIGFTHPGFHRCYLQWIRKNATGVAQAEGWPLEMLLRPPSLN